MAGRFSIEATFKADDKISRIIGRIESKSRGLAAGIGKDFEGLGGRFKKFGTEVADLTKKLAVAGTALGGLAAAGIYSVVKASNDVGNSLGKIQSIIEPMSGTVEDATGRMKAAALSWSKEHTASATKFLDTSYQMLSAGLNERQAAAATKTAMLVSTAAMGDATQAGQLLATLYNNMGDKLKDPAQEFAHLGDVVTQTQAVFQFANFDALNEGLKYGVPAALQYGVNLEQVSTAMGMLNNAGLQGSQAGTSWAASMSKMIKASRELGFTVAKTSTGGVDFGATLANMHKKLGPVATMSDSAKLALQKAFGEEGVRAIALLVDKSDEFNSSLAKVNDNAGVAARATAIIEKAGSGPLEILRNKVEAVKIGLGDAFRAPTSPLVDTIGRAVDSVGRWVEANQGLIGSGIEKVIATVTPVVESFTSSFMEAVPAITEAVGALFTGFGSGAHWLEVAKQGASILGKIAVGAIGVAVVFGGILAAGFELAVDLCNDVIGIWNGLIHGLGAVVFAVSDMCADVGAKWRWFKDEAALAAKAVVDGLVNGIKNGAQWVVDAATGLGKAALDAIKAVLRIQSPSRAFATVGDFAAQGLAAGLDGGAGAAVSASEALAAQVTSALAITAPAPDMSALSNLGSKVPSYATGYDEWPPRASWLGGPAGADEGSSGSSSAGANPPQVTAPTDTALRETIDRHYRESKSTTTNELVIRDQTGRAQLKKPAKGITVAPSGGV